MELKGTVHSISELQAISDKFSKREMVLLIPDDKYPQYLPITFGGKNADLIKGLTTGSDVSVSINLRGRLYVKDGIEKAFGTLEGWKVDVISEATQQANISPVDQSDFELPF